MPLRSLWLFIGEYSLPAEKILIYTKHQITAAEERLRLAMLASNAGALDELISSDLIFTNHMGQILGKQDDPTSPPSCNT